MQDTKKIVIGLTAVTSLKVNGVSITNPTELSNEFNNHFATLELARNIDSPDGDCFQRYITSTDQCFFSSFFHF